MFLRGRLAGLYKGEANHRATRRAVQVLRRRNSHVTQIIHKGRRKVVKSGKQRLTIQTLRLYNAKLNNRTMAVSLSRLIMTFHR